MKPEDLQRRTKQSALRVLRLSVALANTIEGRTVRSQLVRGATAVGANYRAACHGRSLAEFVAKIGVVEEEADESAFWIELIIDASLMKESLVEPLRREAEELAKIMTRSRITAAKKLSAKKPKT